MVANGFAVLNKLGSGILGKIASLDIQVKVSMHQAKCLSTDSILLSYKFLINKEKLTFKQHPFQQNSTF